MMHGPRRAPAAADRPRRAARHRAGCARAAGVALFDVDDLDAQVERTRWCAGPRRARPRASSRRRSRASPAGWARWRCCRPSRALRGARRRDRGAAAGRERGPLGVAVRARPRARRGARPRGGQPPAARADAAREGARAPSSATRACSCCASSSGSRRAAAAAERRRPRSAALRPLEPAHRHPRERAGAGAGAGGGRALLGEERAGHDHHGRRRRSRRGRQVALDRGARARRCWPARSTWRCTRPRTCRASWPRARADRRRRRGPTRATRWSALAGSTALPRGRPGGHERAAPPRAAARRPARPRRRRAARQRRHAAAQARRRRGRRARARRRGARAAGPRRRRRRARRRAVRARARPGNAGAPGARRTRLRSRRPPRSRCPRRSRACVAERAAVRGARRDLPHAGRRPCRVGGELRCAASPGCPTARRGCSTSSPRRAETRRGRPRARPADARAPAPATCCATPRRWRRERHRLSGRRGPGRSRGC